MMALYYITNCKYANGTDASVLHNLPTKIHINEIMINNHQTKFHSLMRKFSANFVCRCVYFRPKNAYINHIMLSTGCSLESDYFERYSKLHFG